MRRILSVSKFDFNPRTHEECDVRPALAVCLSKDFNPRTHEECDNSPNLLIYGEPDFNPRTHEECDRTESILKPYKKISILALTRSATLKPVQKYANTIQFQSSHSRGVRPDKR